MTLHGKYNPISRNRYVSDDFDRNCIVIYEAIDTDYHTHNGQKIIIIAKFNIFPKPGITYNEAFITLTQIKQFDERF
jgi:hypothetical protein